MHPMEEGRTQQREHPEFLDEGFFSPEGADGTRRFLLDLLNSIHESILIINTQTKVCYVNDSYVKMFHVRRERIVGRYLAKFEPLARIHDVLRTRQPITGDISHIYSADLDVYADIIPLFRGEDLVGALALMKNVTELVRVNRELDHFKSLSEYLKGELDSKEDLPAPFRNVLGQDRAFVQVLRIAARAAQSDVSVCIIGESGTGKEVLAEAIHYSSPRASGPLVKINCAAIPENLLESELFGYETGAFTGAKVGGKPGKFELAEHGTIFLDEIGEMPLSMQVKLLRVLQEREVERVGGQKRIPLDFRLITATNRNLEEMVRRGEFREDLYYRINVIGLNIPPLRERREDVLAYAQLFLDEMSRQYGRAFRFSPQAAAAIEAYHWPGNVRELKNCIERAAVLTTEDTIPAELFPTAARRDLPAGAPHRPNTYKLHELLDYTEKEAIITALRMTGGNKTQAMQMLGVSRRSFYQKLEKHQLLNKF